jgi:hypothetical protein
MNKYPGKARARVFAAALLWRGREYERRIGVYISSVWSSPDRTRRLVSVPPNWNSIHPRASPEFSVNSRSDFISLCSPSQFRPEDPANGRQDKRSIFHSILQFPKEYKKEEEEKSLNPFGESKE